MLGLEVAPLVIQRAPAFEGVKTQADALYVAVDQLVVAKPRAHPHVGAWRAAADGFQYPRFCPRRRFMSYGPNYSDLFRRSVDYVDKILRGTKPGDIPVEQPTKFELVINLKTAKALGLTIPESFLLRADDLRRVRV
jgi:putative ABC transport system substrate-binding protein